MKATGLTFAPEAGTQRMRDVVNKNITDEEKAGLAAHVGAQPGDCIFFAAGPVKSSRGLLGAARLEIGRRCGLIDEDAWSFLWVVDAPLFAPASAAVASGELSEEQFDAWVVPADMTQPRQVD